MNQFPMRDFPRNKRRQRGATLTVAMVLLALVTLLGLAGANSAHIELALAQNEQFRENAASAASAGIESAIGRIVTSSAPDAASVPVTFAATLPGSHDRYETVARFLGYERALPQEPDARLAGAHFEIVSTGFAARRAVDRQRAHVLLVVDAPEDVAASECEPLVPDPCHRRGGLSRLSWQRVAVE